MNKGQFDLKRGKADTHGLNQSLWGVCGYDKFLWGEISDSRPVKWGCQVQLRAKATPNNLNDGAVTKSNIYKIQLIKTYLYVQN